MRHLHTRRQSVSVAQKTESTAECFSPASVSDDERLVSSQERRQDDSSHAATRNSGRVSMTMNGPACGGGRPLDNRGHSVVEVRLAACFQRRAVEQTVDVHVPLRQASMAPTAFPFLLTQAAISKKAICASQAVCSSQQRMNLL